MRRNSSLPQQVTPRITSLANIKILSLEQNLCWTHIQNQLPDPDSRVLICRACDEQQFFANRLDEANWEITPTCIIPLTDAPHWKHPIPGPSK
tara:strand:+ start:298 stop:576 length:279 start_codon:yes stop_codon:yes gene_type:complete